MKLLKILIPLVFIAGGVVGMRALINARPQAERRPPVVPGILVHAEPVTPSDRAIEVHAFGTVQPATEITLAPQVQGRVVEVAANVVPGGRLAESEVVLKIDDKDYELAVANAQSALAQAELAQEQERGRKAIANREWDLLGEDTEAGEDAKARALREPNAEAAKAAVKAAKAALAKAKLDMERTELTAPFDALVLSESVDVGQLVSASTAVAKLVGTSTFRVVVALPIDELAWMSLPDADGSGGPSAKVLQKLGARVVEREGRVARLLGDLEASGRMAKLVVEVDDPLSSESGDPPLLLGSYVEVVIEGRQAEGVVELPRSALQEGDLLYVVAETARADAEAQALSLVTAWLKPHPWLGVAPPAPLNYSEENLALARPVVEAALKGLTAKPDLAANALAQSATAPFLTLKISPAKVVRRETDTVLIAEGVSEGERVILSRVAAPIPGMTVRLEQPKPEGGEEGADGGAPDGGVPSDGGASDASATDGGVQDAAAQDGAPIDDNAPLPGFGPSDAAKEEAKPDGGAPAWPDAQPPAWPDASKEGPA